MKVLLDECTPRVLKRLLSEFEISTVQDRGWMGVTNGALLALAEGEFDVFVTTDKNSDISRISLEGGWRYPVTYQSGPCRRLASSCC
jgi:hypothetical protein